MHSVWLNLLTGENHVMLWHSIVQELWKRSPKMTSKEQQQTSSALLKKSRQGTQKANPLCLNKSVIIFCLSCSVVYTSWFMWPWMFCFVLVEPFEFCLNTVQFHDYYMLWSDQNLELPVLHTWKKKHVSFSNFIKIQLV